MALQAVFWWIGPSGGLCGMLAVIVMVTLAVASDLHLLPLTRFAAVGAAWNWAQTAAGSFALSIGTIGLGYVVAVNGVARDRRGEAWSLERLGRWGGSVGDAVSCRSRRGVERRFRSPESAQLWLEWRSKGRLLPLSVAGLVCFVWLCPLVTSLELYEISGQVPVASSLLGNDKSWTLTQGYLRAIQKMSIWIRQQSSMVAACRSVFVPAARRSTWFPDEWSPTAIESGESELRHREEEPVGTFCVPEINPSICVGAPGYNAVYALIWRNQATNSAEEPSFHCTLSPLWPGMLLVKRGRPRNPQRTLLKLGQTICYTKVD